MKIKFYKMSGAGNDFVCVDNRRGDVKLGTRQIAAVCDRRWGVGSDGLILVEKVKGNKSASFRMRYYNADGKEVEMCGNGSRCFGRFVREVIGWKKKELPFMTKAGLIRASFIGDEVKVELTRPNGLALDVARIKGKKVHCINTGVPHAVIFVEDVRKIDVEKEGRLIREDKAFAPKGTNVNFVEVGKKGLVIRTYERGVEAETLACGTGATACAIVAHFVHGLKAPVDVRVKSGDRLKIDFMEEKSQIEKVWLQGPAIFTFKGEINV